MHQSKTVDRNYFGDSAYGDFAVQAAMLDDVVRVGAYYKAIVENPEWFLDKVALDVGTGSGVLAIFAARAGAKKVYAVEASPVMAAAALQLIQENHLDHIITVICGKIEDVSLPEPVDIIVSEPMGYFLLNEQMLQSYLWARQHCLKPGGLLFPAQARLYVAPINANALRQRIDLKCRSWLDKEQYFSINYQSFYYRSKRSEQNRVRIDQILPEQVIGRESNLSFSFQETTSENLNQLVMELTIALPNTQLVHELGLWFDVSFPTNQANECVVLTTAPNARLTHWYQTVLFLDEPVNGGDTLQLKFTANKNRSYWIEITSNTTGKLLKKAQATNIQYDYFDHYQDLILEPSSRFGYEPL